MTMGNVDNYCKVHHVLPRVFTLGVACRSALRVSPTHLCMITLLFPGSSSDMIEHWASGDPSQWSTPPGTRTPLDEGHSKGACSRSVFCQTQRRSAMLTEMCGVPVTDDVWQRKWRGKEKKTSSTPAAATTFAFDLASLCAAGLLCIILFVLIR